MPKPAGAGNLPAAVADVTINGCRQQQRNLMTKPRDRRPDPKTTESEAAVVQASLQRMKAYRLTDPTFSKECALVAEAEAKFAKHDPAEGSLFIEEDEAQLPASVPPVPAPVLARRGLRRRAR